jgi:hypothetical protein
MIYRSRIRKPVHHRKSCELILCGEWKVAAFRFALLQSEQAGFWGERCHGIEKEIGRNRTFRDWDFVGGKGDPPERSRGITVIKIVRELSGSSVDAGNNRAPSLIDLLSPGRVHLILILHRLATVRLQIAHCGFEIPMASQDCTVRKSIPLQRWRGRER